MGLSCLSSPLFLKFTLASGQHNLPHLAEKDEKLLCLNGRLRAILLPRHIERPAQSKSSHAEKETEAFQLYLQLKVIVRDIIVTYLNSMHARVG